MVVLVERNHKLILQGDARKGRVGRALARLCGASAAKQGRGQAGPK